MNRSDDLFPQPGGTPDPYWQRAFDDALETPPPRVWEGVERQLDLDESDGILPLWQHQQGRQSMLFGRWAAGIAASLLLTALGWWAWHREDAIRPDVSVAVASKSVQAAPGTLLTPVGPVVASAEATNDRPRLLPRPATPSKAAGFQVRSRQADGPVGLTRSLSASDVATGATNANVASTAAAARPDATTPDTFLDLGTLAAADKSVGQTGAVQQPSKQFDPSLSRTEGVNGTLIFTETTLSVTRRMKETQPFQSGMAGIQPSPMSRSVLTRSVTTQSFSARLAPVQPQPGQLLPGNLQPDLQETVVVSDRLAVSSATNSPERVAMASAPLAAKQAALRPQSNAAQEAAIEPTIASSKKRRERVWVSAGVAASSFNPAVALRSAFSPTVSSFRNAAVAGTTTAAATLQSQVGRAVAIQVGLGIPLGDHWSVETGVGYVNGQNQVQSPARIMTPSLSVKSEIAANLYADLVGRLAADQSAYNSGTSKQAYADLIANQAGNYASGQQQSVSNAYQFVQLPVQVGYELRPRRKFGLALLTGMVSNWFVRNTVAESITVKAGDGVYRPVTLAGTAGMRLRYRPDTYWSASVAGTFQQSLQSLTHTDVGLQATPQQVGLSFSVDRHF